MTNIMLHWRMPFGTKNSRCNIDCFHYSYRFTATLDFRIWSAAVWPTWSLSSYAKIWQSEILKYKIFDFQRWTFLTFNFTPKYWRITVISFIYAWWAFALIVILSCWFTIWLRVKGQESIFSRWLLWLVTIHTAFNILPYAAGEAFGGMYLNSRWCRLWKPSRTLVHWLFSCKPNTCSIWKTSATDAGEYYFRHDNPAGMYYMISSGNFLLFYIGLEMASIPMATLAALDKEDNKSAKGPNTFFLLLFIRVSCLFGIPTSMAQPEQCNFMDLPSPITPMHSNHGICIFIVGLFFQNFVGSIPLVDCWRLRSSPTNVTAYLSVISKGSAVFVLTVMLYKVFGNLIEQWQGILYGIIIAVLPLPTFLSVRKTSNASWLFVHFAGGYLVLATSAAPLTVWPRWFIMFVYIFSNLAAFGVISAIETRTKKINISDYNGLYSTNPKLSFVMMLAMFSLGGIPPFAGFFSKFFIFSAAAEQGFYVLVLIAVINTIISLYYYLLVVRAMFIEKATTRYLHWKPMVTTV